ncbi:MAG: pyridoxal-phosphate dependent enzyme [Acidobacteriota bacterium]|nr:pyridoxal-phosphate dependent enzyme [Acidobacteriota bacterium]
MEQRPTLKTIHRAHQRIRPYIHHTPVLTCSTINTLIGSQLFFKCENFQKTGSFKMRGASNATITLESSQAKYGVITHSSGNHGAALSLAARNLGISTSVVMPSNTPAIKQAAVNGYGGNIVFCEPTLDDREKTANKVQQETGATMIHPYNNYRMIEGHGTALVELLDEVANLEIIMAPIGGGGLLSGTLIAAKSLRGNIRVVGVEPVEADDAYRSWQAGKLLAPEESNTIADGLRTSLGNKTFPIIRELVDSIVLTSERAIYKAMRLVMDHMKIVIEPSAAVPLAALLEKRIDVSDRRVGIILSGGNVDLNTLPILGTKPD